MAVIIDSSYFIGELSIPNITGTDPVSVANLASVNRLIDLYEKDYLTRLLGSDLYDEFIADIATSEAWATGLRDELRDKTLKVSPVAFYVFYHWLRNTVAYTTSNGVAEGKNENALNVSPAFRMMDAYNRMVNLTYDVIDHMTDEWDNFPSTPETETTWLKKINTFNI